MRGLSKSRFLYGLQCHKKLYLELNTPELATPVDPHSQAIMDFGVGVGKLARQRFPGGVLVDSGDNLAEALRETARLVRGSGLPAIFEATFEYDGVLVRVDILERGARDSWRLIEVKSSTEPRDDFQQDLGIQMHVLQGAGVPVKSAWLMHVNNQHVYPGGPLDLDHFFTLLDLTPEVLGLLPEIPAKLASMKEMLTSDTPPAIEPDHHCEKPYPCAYWRHCTKDKPSRWVFYLPESLRVYHRLVSQGIEVIDRIPDDFPLRRVQQLMKNNVEWISPNLKPALEALRYPIHYLDFETFNSAIPPYPNTRPYQVIPTQWSLHIEAENGEVRHFEYLCQEEKDPREEFARSLLEAVQPEGTICTYSWYEKSHLKGLAEALPDLRRNLEVVIGRLSDLHMMLRKNYYHPGFRGSYSLKQVAPALVPSLDYGRLMIQDGGLASVFYRKMIAEGTDPAEKARIRAALLEYCKQDSLALLEIRRVLLARCRN